MGGQSGKLRVTDWLSLAWRDVLGILHVYELTAIPGVTPKETSLRTGTARQNAYENLV